MKISLREEKHDNFRWELLHVEILMRRRVKILRIL